MAPPRATRAPDDRSRREDGRGEGAEVAVGVGRARVTEKDRSCQCGENRVVEFWTGRDLDSCQRRCATCGRAVPERPEED